MTVTAAAPSAPLLNLAPTPADIGLPLHFAKWRPVQIRAVSDSLASDRRFLVQVLGTGAGKSLSSVAQSLIAGRGVYLTRSKALQRQVYDDFSGIGMTDVRGRANYSCAFGHAGMTCEDGGHLGCKAYKEGACDYVNHVTAAKASLLPVTNYDYWMSVNKYGEGLGDVDLLICDEAASAVDAVCGMLTVELTTGELRRIGRDGEAEAPDVSADVEAWRTWAAKARGVLTKKAEAAAAKLKRTVDASADALREVKMLKNLCGKLQTVEEIRGRWVVDDWVNRDGEGGKRGVRLDPVWPQEYAEELLYCGAPRVLLTSATLNRKTCALLGVPAAEMTYAEYPSTFDPARCLVYWVKSGARVDFRMDDIAVRSWMSRNDQLIRRHPHEKGVVHCVSYQRQRDFYRMSQERRRLLWHSSWNTQTRVEEFKRMPESSGAVLLSPAVEAGFDFPNEECRFQIIAKIPFVDTRSKVMQARIAEDADYPDYLAAQKLIQMCGRPMRSDADYCVTYCTDGHWQWWFPKMLNKGFIPREFAKRVRVTEGVPQ